MAKQYDAQLCVKTPAELLDRIDDWRASQRPIVPRSEAVRALVEKGLQSGKQTSAA